MEDDILQPPIHILTRRPKLRRSNRDRFLTLENANDCQNHCPRHSKTGKFIPPDKPKRHVRLSEDVQVVEFVADEL